jgi:hypothetical protein
MGKLLMDCLKDILENNSGNFPGFFIFVSLTEHSRCDIMLKLNHGYSALIDSD